MSSEQAPPSSGSSSLTDLGELRQLLVGDIKSATVPTIENAIRTSVQEDSNILSEALFPVIGPATRKSVAAAIRNLTQSLNQGLEHSLSPQSFRWRLEAARTGRSFAEVVLLRTLIYQVEQVLLIHKETGLLLQQVLSEKASAQDPELVSAMLTAIQDFVRDSFRVEAGGTLDTLEFGELNIWIEEGPQAVLACVIRGNAPQELRQTLQDSLEKVHRNLSDALQNFDGDQTAFEGSRLYLENCLQAQFKAKRARKEPPTLWILLGIVLFGLGGWFSYGLWTQQRWSRYVGLLNQQPGLVVIQSHKQGGRYYLSGLRDPLAADPQHILLEQTSFGVDQVSFHWNPYLSLHRDLSVQRVTKGLAPPDSVRLQLDEAQVLRLSGVAPQAWIDSAQVIAQSSQSMLGSAIQQWDFSELQSQEQQALGQLKQRIEARTILFDEAKAEPLNGAMIDQLAKDVAEWLELSRQLGHISHILLLGQADARGDRLENLELSRDRARKVQQLLINQGIPPTALQIEALGAVTRLTAENEQEKSGISKDKQSAQFRSVRFVITP